MRQRAILVTAGAVAAAGVLASKAFCSGGSSWSSSSGVSAAPWVRDAAPWQPSTVSLSARGLVREETLQVAAAVDAEELELLARLPSGPHGLVMLLLSGLSENAAGFLRLQSQLPASSDAPLPVDSASALVDEMRVLVEEFILLLNLALRILGAMLTVMMPLSITLYFLLNQPLLRLPASPFTTRVTEIVGALLSPMDWLLCPLLRLAARSTGVSREELLGEDTNGCEAINRAQRILLGLLVLNVLASLITVLALAVFVITVRFSGIFA